MKCKIILLFFILSMLGYYIYIPLREYEEALDFKTRLYYDIDSMIQVSSQLNFYRSEPKVFQVTDSWVLMLADPPNSNDTSYRLLMIKCTVPRGHPYLAFDKAKLYSNEFIGKVSRALIDSSFILKLPIAPFKQGKKNSEYFSNEYFYMDNNQILYIPIFLDFAQSCI